VARVIENTDTATLNSFIREAISDSADAGKDRAFAGTWVPSQGEALNGRFVIQCKFTSKRDKILSQSDLADDVEKARRLVQKGRCDCYILLTNAGLSDSTAEDVSDDQPGLKAAIREVLPESAWQRCYVHFLRNALDYVPQRRGSAFDSTPNHVNMTVQVRLRGLEERRCTPSNID
jgi:hypothetical protein